MITNHSNTFLAITCRRSAGFLFVARLVRRRLIPIFHQTINARLDQGTCCFRHCVGDFPPWHMCCLSRARAILPIASAQDVQPSHFAPPSDNIPIQFRQLSNICSCRPQQSPDSYLRLKLIMIWLHESLNLGMHIVTARTYPLRHCASPVGWLKACYPLI